MHWVLRKIYAWFYLIKKGKASAAEVNHTKQNG